MDRLFPKKNSGRYFILNELRKAYIIAIDKHVPISKSFKLVDYGCGDFPYKPLFGDHVDYLAYDFSVNPHATKYLNSSNTTYESNSSIDVVLSSQVLEHVDNPSIYLKEISRILVDNGIMLLSTHGIWMYHPVPKDLWRWTGEGLKKLIMDNDFEILEVIPIGDLLTSGLQLFQDGARNKLPKRIQKFFFYVIQFLQYIVYNRRNLNDACVYLIIAKKISNE
jgi:SAM-dependent methyltransferase